MAKGNFVPVASLARICAICEDTFAFGGRRVCDGCRSEFGSTKEVEDLDERMDDLTEEMTSLERDSVKERDVEKMIAEAIEEALDELETVDEDEVETLIEKALEEFDINQRVREEMEPHIEVLEKDIRGVRRMVEEDTASDEALQELKEEMRQEIAELRQEIAELRSALSGRSFLARLRGL